MKPAAALAPVASRQSEEPDGAAEPTCDVGASVFECVAERSTDVVVLRLEPVEPDRRAPGSAARASRAPRARGSTRVCRCRRSSASSVSSSRSSANSPIVSSIQKRPSANRMRLLSTSDCSAPEALRAFRTASDPGGSSAKERSQVPGSYGRHAGSLSDPPCRSGRRFVPSVCTTQISVPTLLGMSTL